MCKTFYLSASISRFAIAKVPHSFALTQMCFHFTFSAVYVARLWQQSYDTVYAVFGQLEIHDDMSALSSRYAKNAAIVVISKYAARRFVSEVACVLKTYSITECSKKADRNSSRSIRGMGIDLV